MHVSEVVSSCHILLVWGQDFYKRGRNFPRKSTLGGELFLRIFSLPEKISGGGGGGGGGSVL